MTNTRGIIKCLLSGHNEIKPEINSRETAGKSLNMCRLKDMLPAHGSNKKS